MESLKKQNKIMNIAKITIELPDGSVTRHFDADAVVNGQVQLGDELDEMVDVIISSTKYNF